MAKILGYVLSIAGLIVIAFSNTIAKLEFMAQFGKRALVYPIILAIALIAIGVVLLLDKSQKKHKIYQAQEEVPIYEDIGKHRKIVAYKKESKK